MNDEQLERRMRSWNLAEMAAREAERAVGISPAPSYPDAVESPVQRAGRLRRTADAMLAAIIEDVHVSRQDHVSEQAS